MKKLMLLLPLLGLGAVWWWFSLPTHRVETVQTALPVKVVIHTVAEGMVADTVAALGTARADEAVVLTPKVSELVTAIFFRDGEQVVTGQLLVQLNDAEQQAQLSRARIQVADSLRELKRISTLVSNRTIAESERDRLQTQLDSAKAEVDAAIAAVNDRQIRAPFNGNLGLRQISVGGLVTPGTAVTTLDLLDTIKLDFPVPERFIQQLTSGSVVHTRTAAFPDRVFSGTVTTIDSRVNPDTRAVMVRAAISNPQHQLLPGMLLSVQLVKQQRTAVLVPESAIVPRQQRHFVYVVDKQQQVLEKPITLGVRFDGQVEVTAGLSVGEQVIIRGQTKVSAGQTVQPMTEEAFSAQESTL